MKIITLALLFLLISTIASGQGKGTYDLGAGIGYYSSNDFWDDTSNLVVTGTSAGHTAFKNASMTPVIYLSFKNAIKDKWLLYADGIYQRSKEDVLVNDVKVGDVSTDYITFGLGTEYHYIVKDWFQMYSGASVGYTLQYSDFTGSSDDFEKSNDGYFNFHVNALGFRAGKALAATLEIGVGYKGVANLGVSYQF